MTDDNGTDPGDGMAQRIPGSDLKPWVLMEANRWVLAGVLLSLVFVALVAVGEAWPSLRAAVRSTDPVETLFQAMVAAIITGVTLVVTINQLVLSQELGPVGSQRTKMTEALEFRSEAEAHLDEAVSPADPASFLRSLLTAVGEQAGELERTARDDGDPAAEVASFADDLAADADRIADRLEGAEFGTFRVVSAALDFDYSHAMYEARRLRAAHGDALSPETDRAIEELLGALELFGPAREHFKTLYFQWELIDLSRALLFAAVPAFTTAAAMILFFEGRPVPGTTAGLDHVLLLVALATAVTVGPFMLLVSYVLRIVTVAKRTLATGPFVLRDTGEEGPVGSD